MAHNYGLLSVNSGLLWGIVAYYFGPLGVPGRGAWGCYIRNTGIHRSVELSEPPKWPKQWAQYCLYSLFWGIGPLFGALLEVQVYKCVPMCSVIRRLPDISSGILADLSGLLTSHVQPDYVGNSCGPCSPTELSALRRKQHRQTHGRLRYTLYSKDRGRDSG